MDNNVYIKLIDLYNFHDGMTESANIRIMKYKDDKWELSYIPEDISFKII